jgi:hypothetical protein
VVTTTPEEFCTGWRVLPIGYDRYRSTYWLFDDSRLYREASSTDSLPQNTLHNTSYYNQPETDIHTSRQTALDTYTNSISTLPQEYKIMGPDEFQLRPLRVSDTDLMNLESSAQEGGSISLSQGPSQSEIPTEYLENYGSLPMPDNETSSISIPPSIAEQSKPLIKSESSESIPHSMDSNNSQMDSSQKSVLKIKLKIKAPILTKPKMNWELVCGTKSEWNNLASLFRDSIDPDEAAFLRYLVDLVPLVIRDIEV